VLLLQLALLLMQTLSEVLIELVFESYHDSRDPLAQLFRVVAGQAGAR
jgi:hypothetical protein